MAEYPDGMAYSYFCQSYREFAKTLKRYMRQTRVAGEKVFVDYCGPTVPIADLESGRTRKAQIFVGVLGASNYIYAEAIWNQQLPNWIAGHIRTRSGRSRNMAVILRLFMQKSKSTLLGQKPSRRE